MSEINNSSTDSKNETVEVVKQRKVGSGRKKGSSNHKIKYQSSFYDFNKKEWQKVQECATIREVATIFGMTYAQCWDVANGKNDNAKKFVKIDVMK